MKRLWEVMDTVAPAKVSVGATRALWRGQLVAVVAVGAALAAIGMLHGLVPDSATLLLALAVMAAAALGGVRSTMTAAVLSVAAEIWIDHLSSLTLGDRLLKPILLAGLGAVLVVYARQRGAMLSHLEDREAHLQSILNTVPEAMVVIDDAGVVHSFSPAAERIFGVGAADVLGRNVRELMPEPHRAAHDGYLAAYLTTGERKVIGHRREVTGVRADGSEFPMDLHVGEVIASGRRYFTGFVRDLTPLHEAEQRTQSLRTQLAEMWRLNSVGQMASILAHELNQPLAAITNYLRAARTLAADARSRDESDLMEAIDKAGDQALRAGEVIRGMRSFVTREPFDLQPERVSDLMAELDSVFAMTAREHGVTVIYDLDPDDRVLVNRIQVQQLLGNLVRNAVEATRDSPMRRLKITSRTEGAELVVCVEDSGPGIEPAMAERLFEPMATSKPQGMGLGLSISRSIVERHGGRIWTAESEWGGAAFCFSLPRAGPDGQGAGDNSDDLHH